MTKQYSTVQKVKRYTGFLRLKHGHRSRGEGGTCFSKSRKKCPFSYNLVAFLEKFEDAKINRNIQVSGDFRRF